MSSGKPEVRGVRCGYLELFLCFQWWVKTESWYFSTSCGSWGTRGWTTGPSWTAPGRLNWFCFHHLDRIVNFFCAQGPRWRSAPPTFTWRPSWGRPWCGTAGPWRWRRPFRPTTSSRWPSALTFSSRLVSPDGWRTTVGVRLGESFGCSALQFGGSLCSVPGRRPVDGSQLERHENGRRVVPLLSQ